VIQSNLKGKMVKSSETKKKTGFGGAGLNTDTDGAAAAAKDAVDVGQRRKPRFKPGTVALREVRRFQKTSSMFFPRRTFQRVIRSCLPGDFRCSRGALLLLQQGAEMELHRHLRATATLMDASKKVTVYPEMLKYAKQIHEIYQGHAK
jgi:histone H3